MHAETGSGFFVEPDKIVTTLEGLAGAVAVAAIPEKIVLKTQVKVCRSLSEAVGRSVRLGYPSQISEEAEGQY